MVRVSRLPKRIPERTLNALCARAGGDREAKIPARCERCGKAGANNAHHRMNRSVGGRHDLSNLLLLCGSGTTECHGDVTANPERAHRDGYTVYSYEIPADRRVKLLHGWALLGDSGEIVYVPAPVRSA